MDTLVPLGYPRWPFQLHGTCAFPHAPELNRSSVVPRVPPISQHPSVGFPGGDAVLRSPGRPHGGRSARPKVCSNARTGPFWCQKPSLKSVLYPTYFGPHFSTFQPVQSAIWGSVSSYKRRTNRLDKIIYFDHIHPNMPENESQFLSFHLNGTYNF